MDCMRIVVDFSDNLSWSCTYRFPVHLYIFYMFYFFLFLGVVLLIGGPSTWYPQGCKSRAEFLMCKCWKPTLIPSGNVGTLQRRPIYHIGFAPVKRRGRHTYITLPVRSTMEIHPNSKCQLLDGFSILMLRMDNHP